MGNINIILEITYMVLIISIPIISFILYKACKDKILLKLVYIYNIEILAILITDILSIKFIYCVAIFFIIKIILLKNDLIITKSRNSFLDKLLVLFIGTIGIRLGEMYFMLISIFINIRIIGSYITNKVNKHKHNKIKDKNALLMSKKKIVNLKDTLNKEYELQQIYKDDLLRLNKEISLSIEDSENAIFILNLKNKYIYGNKIFKDLMGLKNDSDIELSKIMDTKFENGEVILQDLKGLNKIYTTTLKSYSGKIYKLECIREVLNNEIIIICILTDITESTVIMDRVRESEQRYRKLMDILQDGVIIHNMSKIKYLNEKALDIFNLKSGSEDFDSEVNFTLVEDKIYKTHKKKLNENMMKILVGKREKVITKVATKDGKILEIITTNIILNDRKLLLSIAIDITHLENAIQEIEQSEKTYKLLLQTLPEGIAVIDKKTNIHIYRNKAMVELLKDISLERLDNIIKEYRSSGLDKFNNVQIKNGSLKEISIAIIDREIEDTYLVVIRNLNDKYKTLKIKETLEEITDKCRFKTEFLTSVSDDIKKPVLTILESSKSLYQYKDNENYSYIPTYIKLVRQNTYRLIRLLENITEIGNIERGIYKLNKRNYDIVKLVKNLVMSSQSYIDEKRLGIEFESNVSSQIVSIDKEKIEKVILNLLSNSIKFTNNGWIKVKIEKVDDKLHISVKDTGVGIPKDKINVIFENFEQVDRTLSRGAEGSGIGLSLVEKIVNAHGGGIDVISKENEGSEFIITLECNTGINDFNEDRTYLDEIVDNDKIDIEFSDIYFNYNS